MSSTGQQIGNLKQMKLTATIIYGTMFSSVLMFGVVLFIVSKDAPQVGLGDSTSLVMILGIAALGVMGLIAFLRSKLMPHFERRGDPISPDQVLGAKQRTALGRYFTACIISWALSEGIAVLGLVSGMVTMIRWPYYLFAAAAIINLCLYPPRYADFEAAVRAADSE